MPTLRGRLAGLDFRQVRDLLGSQGAALLRECTVPDDFDPRTDLYLDDHVFQLILHEYDPMLDPAESRENVVVSLSLTPEPEPPKARKTTKTSKKAGAATVEFPLSFPLVCHCTACSTPDRPQATCPHVATALTLILDEKPLLGLVDPPDLETPLEHLDEDQLVKRALYERHLRAETEHFELVPLDEMASLIAEDLLGSDDVPHTRDAGKTASPWTDYWVRSGNSGHIYRVALRGKERGDSYCDCPDFRTNTLGTCKHIEFALKTARKMFSVAAWKKPYRNNTIFVHVRYGRQRTLHLVLPDERTTALVAATKKFLDKPIEDLRGLVKLLARLEQAGFPVTIYPDAEEMIGRELFRLSIAEKVAEIRKDPANHPLRTQLLKEELAPYQLDGIGFVVAAGRAILADETGLGKTVQGIGVAELLAKWAGIRRVLVVCSAVRKNHWKREIRRFAGRSAKFFSPDTCSTEPGAASMFDESGESGLRDRIFGTEMRGAPQSHTGQATFFYTICTYERLPEAIGFLERSRWDLMIVDDGERICDWQSKTTRMLKRLPSPFALLLTDSLPENSLDDLYAMVQLVDDCRLPPAFRFFHRHRLVDPEGRPIAYKDLGALRKAVDPILLRRTRASVLKELPQRSTRIVTIPSAPEQVRIHDRELRQAVRLLSRPRLSEIDMLRIRKHLLAAQRVCDGADMVRKSSTEASPKLDYLARLLHGSLEAASRRIAVFSEWDSMLDRTAAMLRREGIAHLRLEVDAPLKKRRETLRAFAEMDGGVLLSSSEAVRDLALEGVETLVHLDMPWNPAALERRIDAVERSGRGRRQPVDMLLFLIEGSIEERLLHRDTERPDSVLDALEPESGVETLPLEEEAERFRRRLLPLLLPSESATTGGYSESLSKSASATDRVAALLTSHLETGPDGRRRLVFELTAEESLQNLAALVAARLKLPE